MSRGNWMQTYSGGLYWPSDPRPEDVRIEDIAHHLAMLCRYTGAVRRFYSIAEHSVLVSLMVPPQHALSGLLHDATEAYLNDINRPVKRSPGMEGYRVIEARNWRVIAKAFGLPVIHPAEVEKADAEALFHEQAALMPSEPPGLDFGMGLPRPAVVRPDLIKGWSWEEAKDVFLTRYQEITVATPLPGLMSCPKCFRLGFGSMFGPNCTDCENRERGFY